MKRTAIIGLGVTGYSCVKYLHGRERLLVVDTREQPPLLDALREAYPDVEVRTGAVSLEDAGLDRVIVSPGVDLDSCLLRAIRGRVPFDSDIDLFFDAATAPVIGITGTNGKSTVTALTGHLLRSAGKNAPTGGNLGAAALDLLDPDADMYVLELSSFQLERMREHHFAAACILNLSEDHLDRHGDMVGYAASKQRIYADCDLALANRSEGETLPRTRVPELLTFGPDAAQAPHWGIVERDGERWLARGDAVVLACRDLPIAGRHNEQNALAACALAYQHGVSLQMLAEGLKTYPGLAHRCEKVAVIDGVEFINDSKATNVGATLAALEGLGDANRRHIILIAGGDGKGADFSPLAAPLSRFVRLLIVIGRDARRVAAAATGAVDTLDAGDMADAVAKARKQARPGDLVLLSPACASLDMYPNFAARGEDFSRQVHGGGS